MIFKLNLVYLCLINLVLNLVPQLYGNDIYQTDDIKISNLDVEIANQAQDFVKFRTLLHTLTNHQNIYNELFDEDEIINFNEPITEKELEEFESLPRLLKQDKLRTMLGKEKSQKKKEKMRSKSNLKSLLDFSEISQREFIVPFQMPKWLSDSEGTHTLNHKDKRQLKRSLVNQCTHIVDKIYLEYSQIQTPKINQNVDFDYFSSLKLNEDGELDANISISGDFIQNFLSNDDYESFYRKADIKEVWQGQIERDLGSFVGRWKTILKPRSESIDGILKALGFGYLKRYAVENFESVTEFKMDVGEDLVPEVLMRTSFPFGIYKQQLTKLDCKPRDIRDEDTGYWTTYSCFKDGRILLRRIGHNGVLYEARAILRSDPLNVESGPVQVFQWTYIMNGTGEVFHSERWLKKV